MRRVLLLSLVVVLASLPLFAQKITGTISGVVTDPSGAVVPNASVIITNKATGLTRTATTNAAGEYQALELPFGLYSVTVKEANYKEAVVDNIDVHVATIAYANVTLQMGKTSEQVTVEANDIQVQTQGAQLADVVEGKQVTELPLNGRNFVQLTQLQPGVSTARTFDNVGKGLKGGVDFAINGNSMTNNLFLVDGANNNDIGSNRTILIYPSLDAIAEFKLLRNAYGPEYGQASGGVINIVTKGGTNQWHGSVYYNGRNDKLNSYDFFAAKLAASERAANVLNPATGTIYSGPNADKPILRRNDYGYSLGGPVKKDKLFFFWSQEWNREVGGVRRSGCVPNAAEKNGDFSGGLTCGDTMPSAKGIPTAFQLNGNQFVIDPSKILPGMLDYMQLYPTPNQTCPLTPAGAGTAVAGASGCQNWIAFPSTHLNWRQENARGDYNLTKNNSFMVRYTQDTWVNPAPNAGYWGDSGYTTLESSWSQPSKSIVGKWTSIIGSHLVNDAEFTYSNNRIFVTAGGTNPGLLAKIDADFPTLFPSSVKTHKDGLPTIGTGSTGGSPTLLAPWSNNEDLYSARDDLQWVKGTHTFKFGLLLGFNGKNEFNGGGGAERFSTSTSDTGIVSGPAPLGTGMPFANALLPGTVFQLSEASTDVYINMRWRDYEFYAGDAWKINRRLTLDYGFRWSFLRTPYVPTGNATNFQPSLYNPALPATDSCNGLWVVPGHNPCGAANTLFGIMPPLSLGTPGPNKYLVNQNNHLIAPRLGIAYDVFGNGNTAFRAGIGQFFQRDKVGGTSYILAANAPFSFGANNIHRTLDGASVTSFTGLASSPTGGKDPSNTTPNSWQWNVSLEHSFYRDNSFELSYVGNRAVHQVTSSDINNLSPSLWQQASFGGTGVYQALRPFPNYDFLTWWAHLGDAHYHALQALYKGRLWRGSLINVSYTWSHSIGDVPLDEANGSVNYQTLNFTGNPSLDKGNTQINRPNIFIANFVMPLPELRGSNSIVRGVAGGWQVSTIFTAENGPSTTIYQGGISENRNAVCTAADGASCVDPNDHKLFTLYGNGGDSPGWNAGANHRVDVTGISCTSGSHQNHVYNPAAFTVVGHVIGQPGNEPAGYCQGPKYVDDDLTLAKTWKVTERVNLQFRMDAFNLFNHTNFSPSQNGGPIGNVNCGAGFTGASGATVYNACSVTNPVISAQGAGSDLEQTSTISSHSNRQLQYGLRITF